MIGYETAVIDAAQDWADAVEGGHYGPMQTQIEQAKKRLLHAIADLQAAKAQMDDEPNP